MFPQENTVADYHVPEDIFGPGPYPQQQQAAAGLSLAAVAGSPALAAISAISGLGADDPDPVTGQDKASPVVAIAILTGILAIGGFLSYQAGKAMAPSGSKASTWGWIGVPVGLFTGVLGLGIMGMVSNAKG